MSQTRTFSGGIHPAYNKDLTSGFETVKMPLPAKVTIPVSQHIGAPANPIVKKGDVVKTGQIIAEPGGFISSTIHSSISGKVLTVQPEEHPMGQKVMAITIESDGEDSWIDLETVSDPFSKSPDELKEIIKKAGIVGMGGATFPSQVKISPPADKKIEYIILNGAECEPYLTADHRLMVEDPESIVKGLEIISHITGVKKLYIGIEVNKQDAIKKIEKVLGTNGTIVPLEVKYPQGAEKQLIKAITGREVPPKHLPMEVGAIVFNVATAAAIKNAVCEGKPLIERIVTVTGHGVSKPGNFMVRVGTMVSEVVEFSGGYTEDAAQLIMGGPMMGRSVASDSIPVIKGSGGILVLPEKEVLTDSWGPCIRCGMCLRACPNQQNPQLLGNLIEKGLFSRISEEKLEELVLDDCFECGSCTFVCPANRPIVQFFHMAKAYFRSQKRK
ncbi:electron transport complex subunit RsxC [Myxococcota bacterium]|nr:electron transport complex subunit RsxC [Myxococcota bacterium]MBU1380520.1 electron transport complex subunit RsxC [Myxococcota bacterium]MBU1497291.1 electron transport complex subunit RsxC [Myxococcota bacterium]